MKTERFEMRASADFLKKVDDWRRSQPDIPTRAEAIRRIVDSALGSADDGPTLSALLVQFFEADPETRIPLYGFDSGTSAADAARLTLADRHASPVIPAEQLLGLFEDEPDPVSRQIARLLKRVAR